MGLCHLTTPASAEPFSFPSVLSHFTQVIAVSSWFQPEEFSLYRGCPCCPCGWLLPGTMTSFSCLILHGYTGSPGDHEVPCSRFATALLYKYSLFFVCEVENRGILPIFRVLLGMGHRFPLLSVSQTSIQKFLSFLPLLSLT